MASTNRRIFRRTSLLLLSCLAAACGSGGAGAIDQESQLLSTALSSHSTGAILVNGRTYYLDSRLQVANGTFEGYIHEDLNPEPIIPPDWWQFPDMLIKAHPRGVFVEAVGIKRVGDTGSIHIDLGPLGWLQESFTVVSQNPLQYEMQFQGDMTLPEGDMPLLPWNKSDMHLVYTPGAVTGSAVIRATVLRGQEQVQVTYPVTYNGTFSARSTIKLPATVTADVSFQQFNPNTGDFSGVETSRVTPGIN